LFFGSLVSWIVVLIITFPAWVCLVLRWDSFRYDLVFDRAWDVPDRVYGQAFLCLDSGAGASGACFWVNWIIHSGFLLSDILISTVDGGLHFVGVLTVREGRRRTKPAVC